MRRLGGLDRNFQASRLEFLAQGLDNLYRLRGVNVATLLT